MTEKSDEFERSGEFVKYNPEETREFVNRLLQYDNLAWSEFFRETLLPLAFTAKYRETLQRFTLEPDELICEFYQIVHKNNFARMKKFRCESSIKTWANDIMHEAYKNILFRYEKKKKKITTVSSEIDLEHAQSKMKNGFQMMRSDEIKKQLNAELACLWDGNPLEALVFLLRVHYEFSSKETAFILGKTVNHVDVMKKRAINKMKELREAKHE